MHEMRTIAIDDAVAWACVILSVIRLRCANTADRMEVLLGWKFLGTHYARNIVSLLDRSPISSSASSFTPSLNAMRRSPNYFSHLLHVSQTMALSANFAPQIRQNTIIQWL